MGTSGAPTLRFVPLGLKQPDSAVAVETRRQKRAIHSDVDILCRCEGYITAMVVLGSQRQGTFDS